MSTESQALELAEGPEDASPSLDAAEVGELVVSLVKAVRARQMYNRQNPVYHNVLDGLRAQLVRLFEEAPELHLRVDNECFRWRDHEFASGEGRDSVAFLFFKDGVHSLTLARGFEDEVEKFLDLVRQARQVDRQGDDIVTLLWHADFDHLRYGYQDLLAEGVALPENVEPATSTVSPDLVNMDLGLELVDAEEDAGEGGSAAAPAQPPRPGLIDPKSFEETLYFLSEPELATLREQVADEWERDLKGTVLNALFDRLEDRGMPERQSEILSILAHLLPIFLSRGDFEHVARVLDELSSIVAGDALATEQQAAAEAVFERLSEPEVVGQLVRTLEDGSLEAEPEQLALFLTHLRAPALPVLIAAAEATTDADLGELLQEAIGRIATDREQVVIELLDSPELLVSMGAVRLAGRLGIVGAMPKLRELIAAPEPMLRLATVDALLRVPSASSAEAIQRALRDPDREVRMAAARALGTLKSDLSRGALASVIEGGGLRDADLTEKITLFQAYAEVGGPRAVPLLEQVLHGRGFLGRRQSSDLRACAARALGLIDAPAAREALERARDDADAVVRTAVGHALRRESPPSEAGAQ